MFPKGLRRYRDRAVPSRSNDTEVSRRSSASPDGTRGAVPDGCWTGSFETGATPRGRNGRRAAGGQPSRPLDGSRADVTHRDLQRAGPWGGGVATPWRRKCAGAEGLAEVRLWQRRYWDRSRDAEDWRRHVEYCWFNPVSPGRHRRCAGSAAVILPSRRAARDLDCRRIGARAGRRRRGYGERDRKQVVECAPPTCWTGHRAPRCGSPPGPRGLRHVAELADGRHSRSGQVYAASAPACAAGRSSRVCRRIQPARPGGTPTAAV